MPIYHRLGNLPPKRHTQFEKSTGGLYHEQVFGTVGFDGMASTLYHIHRPTQVKHVGEALDVAPKIAVSNNLTMRRLEGFKAKPAADFLESRIPLLVNAALTIGVAAPIESLTTYFYKNADADELLFVHRGKGRLRTLFGTIDFQYGDYLVIPRGVIYQIEFATADNRLFYMESRSAITTPKKYRNHFGQLQEHAPYCERDYKLPTELYTQDETGDFLIKIKKNHALHPVVYAAHPFDVVGWDGYNYPWGISIHDFEPITGRIHQPPPVHQMFQTDACVVCSFCPRLYDYHPKAIPAPYNHSNIDSDEVLYYVDGDFMSRNSIASGDLTLHPGGIPHGPHPGAYERSIGKKETHELAVMIDTFHPLQLTEAALALDDGAYVSSWLEK
ncbi:homogentisate 1,2-dioxygenase [Arundinibacter roseus]|uniref:Homogentisate 1,2-dioxygenase n=1 Tax=Arundinibacter roseus TaxID=2070510 RepID=A0A4R4KG87_9BACT|nr:homogentisate 1,2-dioxygenase [Arundinibacter roseus]TDB65856.1 homogentisate 1,2-dioxygenase [Arundinibacter roseus]